MSRGMTQAFGSYSLFPASVGPGIHIISSAFLIISGLLVHEIRVDLAEARCAFVSAHG